MKARSLVRGLAAQMPQPSAIRGFITKNDSVAYPWLRLTGRRTRRAVARMAAQGKGKPRALSPPFFYDGKLVHEVKWFGYGDEEYTMLGYMEVLTLFGMDVPYLEWVTYWWSRVVPADVRSKLRRHLLRVPVLFFLVFLFCFVEVGFGARQEFEQDSMVAVHEGKKRVLPRHWRQQFFFRLVEVPDFKWYFEAEPKSARIIACQQDGRAVRGAVRLPVALTDLDPMFELYEDVEGDQRQAAIVQFLLQRVRCVPASSEVHPLLWFATIFVVCVGSA